MTVRELRKVQVTCDGPGCQRNPRFEIEGGDPVPLPDGWTEKTYDMVPRHFCSKQCREYYENLRED